MTEVEGIIIESLEHPCITFDNFGLTSYFLWGKTLAQEGRGLEKSLEDIEIVFRSHPVPAM